MASTTKRPKRTTTQTMILPFTVESTSRWSLKRIKKALDAHERGDFFESSLLVDAMGRDDRITACSHTRVNALLSRGGLSFCVEPAKEGPKRRNQEMADEVYSWWFDALPESVQATILWWGAMLGVHVSKVDWSRGKEWTPTVRPWPMQHVSWDESVRQYAVLTREGRTLIDPEDPEWMVYTPYGYDRAWMHGLVRCLGIPFLMRQLAYRDWARFSERHGLPLIIIKEPAQYDEEDKERFSKEIENLGTNGVARLPQPGEGIPGFDIEFREAKDTGWETFREFKKDLDSSIAIVLLGQNLTTEVSGGSFAAAKVQDRVRTDYLAADAEGLSTTFRQHIIQPWLAYNYGLPAEQAPWPEWESAVPDDIKTRAETTKLAGEAVAALQATGLRIDFAELAEELRLPMLPGPALEEPKETPPPPAPPQDQTPPDQAPEGQPPEGQAPEDQTPPDQAPEGQPLPASVSLASGDSPADARGFVDGQEFADRLVRLGARQTQEAIRPAVDKILAAIRQAGSFEEARVAILDAYKGADTGDAQELARRVLILARLAGRAAVFEDL